jgi:hypothetical protein
MNTELSMKTIVKRNREELKSVKPYLLDFFGDRYDRGLLNFTKNSISYLHELICEEYPVVKLSIVEFFLLTNGWERVDTDKISLTGTGIPIFLNLIGRARKTPPKYTIATNITDTNTRGERKMPLADRIISLALAHMISEDRDHFELTHRNASDVMTYIRQHGFYDRFKNKKPFASEERLVIGTVKTYLSRWGYYISDHSRAGLRPGSVCRCTDDQYEEFKLFLLDLDDAHYSQSI